MSAGQSESSARRLSSHFLTLEVESFNILYVQMSFLVPTMLCRLMLHKTVNDWHDNTSLLSMLSN